MTHDESKLPKWAQCELTDLRRELEGMRKAHAVLFDYGEWFTVGVGVKDPYRLFTCTRDGTHTVCTVGDGAVLLVGRKRQ